GEKTGTDLIQRYGSLGKLYEDLDALEVKPAVRRKLEEGRQAAEMSYDLATIRRDAPLALDFEKTLRKPVNQAALYQLFLELEFTRMISEMGLHAPQGDRPRDGDGACLTGDCTMEEVVEPDRAMALLAQWETADLPG
ncbi:MAG: polymerase, partial [Firmicutes bacterium]|nr:polymerase [Bacillota bacterium]